MPGVEVMPFHLTYQRAEGGTFVGWPDGSIRPGRPTPPCCCLPIRSRFRPMCCWSGWAKTGPVCRCWEAWPAAARSQAKTACCWASQVHRAGAVAVLLSGGIRVRSVVSQGCRPIGKPMVITKAQQNVVLELGGKPALAQLRELFEATAGRPAAAGAAGLARRPGDQ